jgi:pimeloyl-ACP methyl ester carboxylesterase
MERDVVHPPMEAIGGVRTENRRRIPRVTEWSGCAGCGRIGRIWAGTATDADQEAATPFFYGRWDAAARAHAATDVGQTNEEAAGRYAAPGAFQPAAARAAAAVWDGRVLLVAGALDSGPLPRVAAAVADLFPRAEAAVLPGAGHFPWLDDPKGFRERVAGFLDDEDR